MTGTRWKAPGKSQTQAQLDCVASLFAGVAAPGHGYVGSSRTMVVPPPITTWLCGPRKQLQGATRQRHQLVLTAAKAAQQRLEAMKREAALLAEAFAALSSLVMCSKLIFYSIPFLNLICFHLPHVLSPYSRLLPSLSFVVRCTLGSKYPPPPSRPMHSSNCPDGCKPLLCSLCVSSAFPLSCLPSSCVRLWERSQLHFCTCRMPSTVSRHCNYFLVSL